MNILVADDEPLACELLERYIARIPSLHLAGVCNDAIGVFAELCKQPVDLVLLDINMPEITGIDLLKSLRNPPLIIFTTAHREYALESYELNAVDYLLKPIMFPRFAQGIRKAAGLHATHQDALRDSAEHNSTYQFIRADGKMLRINLAELWFIEGYKNYVRFWMDNERILVHSTMKNMEEALRSRPEFMRVSKSHLVNLRHITELDGNCLRIRGEELIVGSTYREAIHKWIERLRLG